MQELVATGSTVDEAVDNACAQLGLSRGDVTYEIIEMPQKKLFGTSPAKVSVKPIDDGFSVAKIFAEPPSQKVKAEKPRNEKPRNEKRESSLEEGPKEYDTDPVSEAPEIEIPIDSIPVPAKAALEYFKEVSAHMGALRLEYRAYQTERGIKFAVDGEDSALVIGRRGETMESLQYLCMLVSSRTEGDYCKIIVDVANYRIKREKTLRALAIREAEKVKKTLFNQTLEPMNPYERRIVHSAIQNIEGVKSESVGSEPHRRVVISMISGGKGNRSRSGGRPGNDRKGSGNDRRGNNRSGTDKNGRRDFNKGGGNNRPAYNKPQPPRPQSNPEDTKTKSESADVSKLYGKIDL